jgi:hypothetical protein
MTLVYQRSVIRLQLQRPLLNEWNDFACIDTATFLADGLSNVAATRLMALMKCVILFDEVEEFALDRETPGLSMESRMLTTAMLTAINDLSRTQQQSVFFIPTNLLRAFDSPHYTTRSI